MTTAAAILARLDTIEQQNQHVLTLLAKLAGVALAPSLEGLPPDVAELISLARVDRSASIAEAKRRFKEAGKKKKTSREVRV